MLTKGDERAGAIFSDCERYRYLLWRIWDQPKPVANFCMLNPSTATHELTDNTITRCRIYAEDWGYGGFYATNIHAFRATKPKDLYAADDPTGPENDVMLKMYAATTIGRGGVIVCAWGQHGGWRGRGAEVRSMLAKLGKLHYLRMGSNGQPWHPLYLPKDLKPMEWTA